MGLSFFLACTRLCVYTVIIDGWSSNSSNSGHSLLGGLRALTQTISHEVRLAFILLSFVVLICRYNLACFYSFQIYLSLFFLSLPLSFILFNSCLAETNRTPFDFTEEEESQCLLNRTQCPSAY